MHGNVVSYSAKGAANRGVASTAGRIMSTVLALVMIAALILGFVLSADIAGLNRTKKVNAILAGMDSLGSNVVTATLGGMTGTARAADCGTVKSNSDNQAGFNSCIDESLNKNVGDLNAVDDNGNECQSNEKVENGKCVKDFDSGGSIKENPMGFFNKMKTPKQVKDDPSADNPSIMDILSMITNRWILPGYYINSDFQNFNGNTGSDKHDGTSGDKVAPGTGPRQLPAEIYGVDKDGNKVEHMYAWRDMQCETGLTDPITGEKGPDLRTSNCDIPGGGTEAIQDLAALIGPGGLSGAEMQSTKTPFDMGYSRDLLPTSDVPLNAAQRSDKYTGLELFGYNLHWTNYKGEFDRIKVRTQSSMSLMANLHNAFKIVGNAIGSGWQAVKNQTAASVGQMLDDDNSFWDRVGGFIGVINPFKKAWEFLKATAYSAMSDIAYIQETQMATYGSWYRPDFPNTVYGARGLTTLEKSALLSLTTKQSMVDSFKKAMSKENWEFNETKLRSKESIPAGPKMVWPKDRPASCPADGDTTKTGEEADPACNKPKQKESWTEWKDDHPELGQKTQDIGIDMGKYDKMSGDADTRYKSLKEDWGPAVDSYIDSQRMHNSDDIFRKLINDTWGSTMENINILGTISDANTMFCKKADGTPDGTTSNTAIQTAISHNFMKNPGREAYDANGKWQCDGQPRPSIVGGLMGSSRKGLSSEYHDTRRDYYTTINLAGLLTGQLDKLSQKLLTLSQDVIVVLNTLIEWSFVPILDKLGVADLVKTMLGNLRETIYMQLVVLFIAMAALGVAFRLIRGQPVQSFKSLASIILVFFLGIMILFNTNLVFKVVDDMPAALERASIGLIFNSSGEDKICKATGKPAGTLSAGSFSGIDGNGLGFNPDAQVRTIQCRIWETFVLAPWSYGQFGTSVNNLYATGHADDGMKDAKALKTDRDTQDLVGDAGVDMGGGTVVHNWALYQVAHTTTGTITTEDTRKPARQIDKNMYKLVDVQAGPNNAKGRDTSHMEAWAGDSGPRFFVGLTALPAAILGLISIGSLAIKKISYTLMMSLLLLAAPFMLLVGLIPGKGLSKLKQYGFEVLGYMLKRILTVVIMAVALEVMMEITNSNVNGWTSVVIGIYAVCLMVIFYADRFLSMLTAKVDSAAGSWGGTYDKAKQRVQSSSLYTNMKRDAHDMFIGGAGAALGIILTGTMGTRNKRRDLDQRLGKRLADGDQLIKRELTVKNGKKMMVPIYHDGVAQLDNDQMSKVIDKNGRVVSTTAGKDTVALARAYQHYQNLLAQRDSMAEEHQAELRRIKALPDSPQVKMALINKENDKYNEMIGQLEQQLQYAKADYKTKEAAYEKATQVLTTLDQSDLYQQLRKAHPVRSRSFKRLGNAILNTAKADFALTRAEAQDNKDVSRNGRNLARNEGEEKLYNGNLVKSGDLDPVWIDETNDPSILSEAKNRISKIQHRTHLFKLRSGMANPFIETKNNIDQQLDTDIRESGQRLRTMMNNSGSNEPYYGVDETGKPIHTLQDALGTDISEEKLRSIVLSSPDPRKIESDMAEAIETGDWRAVRNDIGNQARFNEDADNTIKGWGFDEGTVDEMITQQLIANGVDPTNCTLMDQNRARQQVIEMMGVDSDYSAETLMDEMASSNIIDDLKDTKEAALRRGLGKDYEKIVNEQLSEDGQKKLRINLTSAQDKVLSSQDQLDRIDDLIADITKKGGTVSASLADQRNKAADAVAQAQVNLDNVRKDSDKIGEVHRDWKNAMNDRRIDLCVKYAGRPRKLAAELRRWTEAYNTLLAVDDQFAKIDRMDTYNENESAIDDNNYHAEVASDRIAEDTVEAGKRLGDVAAARSGHSTRQQFDDWNKQENDINEAKQRYYDTRDERNEHRKERAGYVSDNSKRTSSRSYSGDEQQTADWFEDEKEKQKEHLRENGYKSGHARRRHRKGRKKDQSGWELRHGRTPSSALPSSPLDLEHDERGGSGSATTQSSILGKLGISRVENTYYDRPTYQNADGRVMSEEEVNRLVREETRKAHGSSSGRKRPRTHRRK